jgi:hypothetical protein
MIFIVDVLSHIVSCQTIHTIQMTIPAITIPDVGLTIDQQETTLDADQFTHKTLHKDKGFRAYGPMPHFE